MQIKMENGTHVLPSHLKMQFKNAVQIPHQNILQSRQRTLKIEFCISEFDFSFAICIFTSYFLIKPPWILI